MPDTKKDESNTSRKQKMKTKDLYLAKSLTQLNTHADEMVTQLKTTNFNRLCRAADKLWAIIDPPSGKGSQDDDQELTYVLLLRYIQVLRLIETSAGDKKFVYARFGQKLEIATKRWEGLRKSLCERYRDKEELTVAVVESSSMDAIVATSLQKLKDKPPVSPEFQFLAKYLCDAKSTDPKCLYQLLQDKIKILLIDIRFKSEYANSHIKCDAEMINIDGGMIRKGMSAFKLGSLLPDEIRPIFENRKKYDLLVVLDENSFPMSHIHAIGASNIYTFLDIINNWDLDSDSYPNGGPVMLQGGFAGWRDHYPTVCTNPQARFGPSSTTDFQDTFMDIDYPTFNYDPLEKKVLVIDRSNKPIYPAPTKKITEETVLPSPPAEGEKVAEDEDTDVLYGSDIESDEEEAAYKGDDIFDHKLLRPIGAQPDDESAVRRGLAYLAVSLRSEAKRRLINLNRVLAFRSKYDAMDTAAREDVGDNRLLEYLDAVDRTNEQVIYLGRQRSEYVVNFPYLASASNERLPPHGPVTARADYVFNYWQTRYMSTFNDNNESMVYIRGLADKLMKSHTTSSTIIPPRLSVPKIPDRTFQPAAIWLPKVNNLSDMVTGLANYHNNCFLNATVQAMRHVPTVYKYILNRDYKADLKKHKQSKVQLLVQLAKVMEDLWKSHHTFITAEKLYKTMLEACPIFEDWRHEDGLECFTLLFTRICEETEHAMRIQDQYEFYRSDKIEHWIRLHNRQISFLSQRFYYEIKRTRDCKKCNRKMITYDISNSMMLPLKLQNEAGGMYQPKHLELQEAVTAYMVLPDRYKILCTKCKKMAIEYKKIKYYPEVMVINLKRYANASSTTFFRSNTLVSFPEKNLKIGIAHYRLNAVVCHTGTMEQGHYTALCLNPIDNKWYYYDDSTVTIIKDIHTHDFRHKCYVFYYSLETEFQRLNLHYAKL